VHAPAILRKFFQFVPLATEVTKYENFLVSVQRLIRVGLYKWWEKVVMFDLPLHRKVQRMQTVLDFLNNIQHICEI